MARPRVAPRRWRCYAGRAESCCGGGRVTEIAASSTWRAESPSPAGLALTRATSAAFAFGIALDVVPLGGVGSVARIAGLAFSAAVVWRLLLVGRVRPPTTAVLLLTGFTAWAALSVFWASDVKSAVTMMMSYAQLLSFLWLGWQVVRTRRDWQILAAGYVAGCAVATIATWMANLAGVAYSGAEYDTRYAAFGFDPNDMGVTLAIAIPLAVHLGVAAKGIRRIAWFSYVPLAVSATVLTGSRGASITTAVALASATYIGMRTGARFVVPLGGLVTAGLVAATLWSPPATWRRIVTLGSEFSGGTLSDRVPIWSAGLAVLARHPLAGVGVAGFPEAVTPALSRSIVAHNTPLSVAVELGVVGLALFLGAFLSVVRASRVRRSARRLVLAIVGTWFVGAASLTWEYRKTTWLVLLLAATVSALEDVPAEDDE